MKKKEGMINNDNGCCKTANNIDQSNNSYYLMKYPNQVDLKHITSFRWELGPYISYHGCVRTYILESN